MSQSSQFSPSKIFSDTVLTSFKESLGLLLSALGYEDILKHYDLPIPPAHSLSPQEISDVRHQVLFHLALFFGFDCPKKGLWERTKFVNGRPQFGRCNKSGCPRCDFINMGILCKQLEMTAENFFKLHPEGSIFLVTQTNSNKVDNSAQVHDIVRTNVLRRFNEKGRISLAKEIGHLGNLWVVEDTLSTTIHHHAHIAVFSTRRLSKSEELELSLKFDSLFRQEYRAELGDLWNDKFLKPAVMTKDGQIKGGIIVSVIPTKDKSKIIRYVCKEATAGVSKKARKPGSSTLYQAYLILAWANLNDLMSPKITRLSALTHELRIAKQGQSAFKWSRSGGAGGKSLPNFLGCPRPKKVSQTPEGFAVADDFQTRLSKSPLTDIKECSTPFADGQDLDNFIKLDGAEKRLRSAKSLAKRYANKLKSNPEDTAVIQKLRNHLVKLESLKDEYESVVIASPNHLLSEKERHIKSLRASGPSPVNAIRDLEKTGFLNRYLGIGKTFLSKIWRFTYEVFYRSRSHWRGNERRDGSKNRQESTCEESLSPHRNCEGNRGAGGG